jgi:hypothetical protein
MKLAVEFPSVSYREGPAAVIRLAQSVERIGYDHIDIFDRVVIGIPSMVSTPRRDTAGKSFYADHDAVMARAAALKAMGFGWVTLNATAIFQAGARSVEAITDSLARLHDRIRAEVG